MSFRERLANGPILLFDGGMGSLLMARGLAGGRAPEHWTIERGEEIVTIHRSYVDAGSEAVQTNTFGAHPLRLAAASLAGRTAEVVALASEQARRSGARWVVGDIGPTGEYLAPVGSGDPECWREGFVELGQAFRAAGVDALHVETMSDLEEAKIALSALREAAPEIPTCVSLTFERRPRGYFTVMGNRIEAAVEALAAAGAAAIGANCTLASRDFGALARAARSVWSGPLILQPNAGAPVVEAGGARYEQPPSEFAHDLAALAEELAPDGAGLALGGCCGTDPHFLRALAEALRNRGLL